MADIIRFGRKTTYGAFGRNGAIQQTGLYMFALDDEVFVYPINSRDEKSGGVRMSIPIDKIDNVIEVLQSMKAKALEERNLLGFAEANQEIATVT